ncbi:tripartite tricarboxylate transporter substrate binding protein [Variovorax sp. WS11]|uniref:Bug family tripartite tricarboxylate transporter substrate binding protein n=1 Tax=Variovorax sp. WS11 TaxID=1105204 RepID=UPI0013DD6007|nr:tripartite tricarboxylate transporter substrate binding protein [Variovorax sp. WS11]NDZ14054.1 tripartite tricarboxylate transporter substrate binding protein [Variovorax sp. WS11]
MRYLYRTYLLPALSGLLALSASCAGAQPPGDYPVKPVVMVVAGPPAGGTDAIARIAASELSQNLGQSVVVDNRAGAGGIIGTKVVAGAAPDGHTLLMGQVATNAIVPALIKPRPYDPLGDFVPVALIGTAPDLLVVSAKSGIKTLDELLAKGRAGAQLTYASPGVGLPQHIAGFALAKTAGIPMQHVPYRGSAPAITDLIGGQVSMMFVTPGAAVPFLKSGQLKALAVTSRERSRFFPQVPTVVELGYPSVEETGWFGVFAPAGTPAPVVQKLSSHLGHALGKPQIREKLEAMYLEPSPDTSASYFAGFVKSEVAKWANVVQKLGVSAE